MKNPHHSLEKRGGKLPSSLDTRLANLIRIEGYQLDVNMAIIHDNKPSLLIPAYKPSSWLISAAEELVESGVFGAVVVVDDGCESEYGPIFLALAEKGVEVVHHAINLGKGAALKTGFNHILVNHANTVGIVTADADGQHAVADIISVALLLTESPRHMVLGERSFGADVPLRSRLGNIITKYVVRFLAGITLRDTQTGLRGVPKQLATTLLTIPNSGYDFELECLLVAKRHDVPTLRTDIKTIYIDNNTSSHFRPIVDSLLIYFVLVRQCFNSLATAIVDYLVFLMLMLNGFSLLNSIAAGRVLAGLFNFVVAKNFVFRSRGAALAEFTKYAALVVFLATCSYFAIDLLQKELDWNPLFSKLLVELILFIFSFTFQRVFVFTSSQKEVAARVTDWEDYYTDRTSVLTPTRRITANILIKIARRYVPHGGSVIELGGGDSCFYQSIVTCISPSLYTIVDSSSVAIDLFRKKSLPNFSEAIKADLLAASDIPKADVVFSVGLIEHFDREGTATIVRQHFRACNSGGLVVISYPTPTISYRIIRKAAELLGIWRFHDERALESAEVLGVASQSGKLVYRELNWMIGLTREVLVFRNT